MSKPLQLIERRRLRDVAREYEKRGYEVLMAPQGSDLPEFLRDFEPDLIAHSGEEWVVVEVKTQPSLVGDEQLSQLTEVVSSRPGWRLELVVTNPSRTVLADTHRIIDEPELRRRLADARSLVKNGSAGAAMLVLWSATEAMLRRIAQEQAIKPVDDDPGPLLKQLVVSGCIARAEYDVLRAGIDARNALVHGFEARDLSPQLVDQIADVVHGLAIGNGLNGAG